MSDYAPPSGPPPPRVPEGWKAQWNEQYQEWFYVNLHTKVSQWELPTQPAYPSSPTGAPSGPPPTYTGSGPSLQPEKQLHSNNPYSAPQNPDYNNASNIDSDAAYAARLQAEEDERARTATGRPTSRGAADTYYGSQAQQQAQQPQPPGLQGNYPGAPGQQGSYDQHELPPREQKSKGLGGLLSKLSGKASGGGSSSHGYPSHGGGGFMPQQPGFGGGGYPPQQPGYGGYPPQQGYGGGYGVPPKRHGGMGAGGAAALGLGGGLLGGALLADSMGGDDGGEDYGGDDGGGDFGGGDD
ncbi:MAG: hypothetical protein LQ343_004449 [Gyalolechia ehrenbergii]|nr:MAG: hypothetical protein LQ343_004449 [Gyalolechia ehrenbergii]